MPEIEFFTKILDGSTGSVYGLVLLYFVWQVKNSISSMGNSIEQLELSLSSLNVTLSALIADRERDKEEIDRLRDEFSAFRATCPAKPNKKV